MSSISSTEKLKQLLAIISACFLFLVFNKCWAFESDSFWIDGEFNNINSLITVQPFDLTERESALPLTGGSFWHYLVLDIADTDNPLVIDFQSSSVVGKFTHYIINSHQEVIQTLDGGIQSNAVNPYFLRHGRPLELTSGQYHIYTLLESPFLLAQPTPKIYDADNYTASIKTGNTFTLLGLGVFLALGFYYITLGVVRRQAADFLYAIFILGNLTYNSTALNVLSDVVGIHSFYSIGFPIMASNAAYIGFVMLLLGINKDRTPYLHRVGIGALCVIGSFWLIVPFMPNYSLEFARYGVAVFSLFGISTGIIMAIRGLKTARYYLVANVAFIIPATVAIGLQSIPDSTIFIEHIGLLAVAIEVILLSLVLSYQLSVMYKEKSASLVAAQEALLIADNAIKTKERFLANISHELRTPLNAIQGSVELLSEKVENKETKEHVSIIRHSSSFLLFLINDILDLAKLNADMLSIEKRPFNLVEMVAQICSIYSSSFTVNSNAKFKLKIDPNVPKLIIGDEKRIEQVIANLLSNAFKFTDNGTVSFDLSTSEDGQFLKFSVTDNGIGIEENALGSMFSAFTQADSSISRKYGGTGLGLRIASKIVELMGGEIKAESLLGQGSHFWFTIPIEIASAKEQSEFTEKKVEAYESFPGLKIVVIDDNDVNLKVIQSLLKRLETTTTVFSRAKDAIAFLQEYDTDIVIMDVQMPEIDGLTAARQLRSMDFQKPIIAFTANANEEDQIACLDAGMNDILIKPIKLQYLTKALRKWRTTQH